MFLWFVLCVVLSLALVVIVPTLTTHTCFNLFMTRFIWLLGLPILMLPQWKNCVGLRTKLLSGISIKLCLLTSGRGRCSPPLLRALLLTYSRLRLTACGLPVPVPPEWLCFSLVLTPTSLLSSINGVSLAPTLTMVPVNVLRCALQVGLSLQTPEEPDM